MRGEKRGNQVLVPLPAGVHPLPGPCALVIDCPWLSFPNCQKGLIIIAPVISCFEDLECAGVGTGLDTLLTRKDFLFDGPFDAAQKRPSVCSAHSFPLLMN